MIDTCTPTSARDICPTRDDLVPQVLALLPRGRAWGNHDGGPFSGVMLGFWTAIADVLAFANKRICELREEFFCKTANETLDVWDEEYGLPDGCDPFPDLCTKVAALGSARCEYFQHVCARFGWTIDCVAAKDECGVRFGGARFGVNVAAIAPNVPRFGTMRFGRRLGCAGLAAHSAKSKFGSRRSSMLRIIVFTHASPAYKPPTSRAPRFGRQSFGQRLGCGTPSIQGLQCLIERIAPAHAEIVYEVI